MSNLTKLFTHDESVLFLNSGTESKAPDMLLDAVTRYQREHERNPTQTYVRAWGEIWRCQQELASFFGARAEDLFLRHNVTEAINAFVLGMPLPAGSEILMTDLEYGAVANICRFRAERDGLGLRAFGLPGDYGSTASAEELTETVLAQIRPRTSLLVLSHVISATGLVLPIARIARETRRRGVLLAIDGAHAPGAFKLDFSTLADVDFYGGNLHKWMMGPRGTAFGWAHPSVQARLRPLEAGWTTFETPGIFAAFGGGSRFAAAFTLLGTHDFAPFLAIHDMLGFWREVGEERIHSRIRELQGYLETRMAERIGWRVVSPPAGPMRGPLLAYELPRKLEEQGPELMQRLFDEHRLQIAVSPALERWLLRLSPHVYNTESELDRAVDILRHSS